MFKKRITDDRGGITLCYRNSRENETAMEK